MDQDRHLIYLFIYLFGNVTAGQATVAGAKAEAQ